MDPAVFERPSFKALISLFNNYEKTQGKAEYVSQTEKEEVDDFLDAVLATDVGQKLHEFLDSKGKCLPVKRLQKLLKFLDIITTNKQKYLILILCILLTKKSTLTHRKEVFIRKAQPHRQKVTNARSLQVRSKVKLPFEVS